MKTNFTLIKDIILTSWDSLLGQTILKFRNSIINNNNDIDLMRSSQNKFENSNVVIKNTSVDEKNIASYLIRHENEEYLSFSELFDSLADIIYSTLESGLQNDPYNKVNNEAYSIYRLGQEEIPSNLKFQMVFYFSDLSPLYNWSLTHSFMLDGDFRQHYSLVHDDGLPVNMLESIPLITPVYELEFDYRNNTYFSYNELNGKYYDSAEKSKFLPYSNSLSNILWQKDKNMKLFDLESINLAKFNVNDIKFMADGSTWLNKIDATEINCKSLCKVDIIVW
jgi:hypothetical protein